MIEPATEIALNPPPEPENPASAVSENDADRHISSSAPVSDALLARSAFVRRKYPNLKMRAGRREWLVLAGQSQGRAQYAHPRSTSHPRGDKLFLRCSGQVIERGMSSA